MEFTVGQRWISHTEADLGLGIVVEKSGRQLTITFPAAAERRTYAVDNCPLIRVIYKIGDKFMSSEDLEYTVTGVEENDGLVEYEAKDQEGQIHPITELELSSFVQFTSPRQRLYSGQLDKPKAYLTRLETLHNLNEMQRSPVQGLLGSRTNLLPHQIYIASEVAQRHAPRVLLADEVGLGKTIEAGLIIHQQLITGRAQRILILVPETLVHQWLVEMLRRFNLHFSVFDKNRVESIVEEEIENPFDTEQLIICSLDFVAQNETTLEQATASDWDLLIVDEAHHLQWNEDSASAEYQSVERLAQKSQGLLLLTATPEQLGVESHFARLRLLDPDRFYDLAKFRDEESHYRGLNQIVQGLIEGETVNGEDAEPALSDEQFVQMRDLLGETAADDIISSSHSSHDLITHLLDRHGTGRVLFRNTRSSVQGFPQRELKHYALEYPEMYANQKGIAQITPESAHATTDWTESDPRVSWLQGLLKQLRPEKVLVICSKLQTAIELEEFLRVRCGVHCADFHENLSIIERDRAAAWFSEIDGGAQTLICSEIGSEGRNFQFAHHLVLFDLPLNPDLLEQRIGRLDRIGQLETIRIHAPYFENTAQEVLFRWYHEGVNLFEHSSGAGLSIFENFQTQLDEQLNQPTQALESLIEETRQFADVTHRDLHEGRDRLLELNSCRRQPAEKMIQAIQDAESNLELQPYMESVWDLFGVDHDYHSEHAQILRPSEQMQEPFPSLREEGMTVTFDREHALIREDMTFLSWEHPMVEDTMEMIQNSEFGNVTMSTISVKGIEPGTLLLETTFVIVCVAPRELQLNRFLSLSPIRLVVDSRGKNLTEILGYEALNSLCQTIPKKLARAVVKQEHNTVEDMIHHSESHFQPQFDAIIQDAEDRLKSDLNGEIERLSALQRINPNVRDEEIDRIRQQLHASEEYIAHTQIKLDALRLVVNT